MSALPEGRPWRRALLWLAFLGPFFFISYGWTNWLASQRADVGAIVFAWERHIPFVAWTIVPYWLIDLFYGVSLLLPRCRAELDAHARRLLSVQAVSVVCFIAFPLRYTFERPETAGVFGWLFDVLLGFDKPYNQAPSLHISLLVILWSLYLHHARGAWRWVLHGVAVLIGASVLTTYQHHFIDIPTGVLAGGLCVLAVPLKPSIRVHQRDARRLTLAAAYLAGAGLFAAPAWLGGAWLWLLWPASALTIVAGIYLVGDPTLFTKREGRIEPAVAVLLAPYLAAAWLNSRWWTRRRPEAVEVVPDLWLSRLPADGDASRYAALVDCSAELPVNAGGKPLYTVPMLDLLTPEPEQIEHGVAAISAARRHGDTLVFCALGFSRSATLIAAWLMQQGMAADSDEAIARVRLARQDIVLSDAHRAVLTQWRQSQPAHHTQAVLATA